MGDLYISYNRFLAWCYPYKMNSFDNQAVFNWYSHSEGLYAITYAFLNYTYKDIIFGSH